jgi:hypothetical protein
MKTRVYRNIGKSSNATFIADEKEIRKVLTEEKLDDFGS